MKRIALVFPRLVALACLLCLAHAPGGDGGGCPRGGMPKDEKPPEEWFRKAADGFREEAERGAVDAAVTLGILYKVGGGSEGRGAGRELAVPRGVRPETGHGGCGGSAGQI